MFDSSKIGKWANNMQDMISLTKKLQSDENLRQLFSSSNFQDLIQDSEVTGALKSKNYMKLMGLPKFQNFLNHPDTQRALQTLKNS